MRILIPLDGSARAETAIGPAAHLVRAFPHPYLVLLRVVEPLPTALRNFTPPHDARVDQRTRDACEDYLRDIAQRDDLHGVVVEPVVASGLPAAMIGATARSQHMALIVMTRHGRASLTQSALGSVAAAVVRTSASAILILPDATSTRTPMTPMRILVPLDGSARAEAVLPLASQLAHGWHAEMRLLRVVATAPADGAEAREQIHVAHSYLEHLQHRLAGEGITTHISVTRGVASTWIMLAAQHEQLAGDVVALVTHGYGEHATGDVENVAAHVLHHLQRPLLIVPPPPEVPHGDQWRSRQDHDSVCEWRQPWDMSSARLRDTTALRRYHVKTAHAYAGGTGALVLHGPASVNRTMQSLTCTDT